MITIWDFQILGVKFYDIINWFYIYSFFGWCFESTYVSIKEKRLINRGFINGPLCTIYGAGAVSVYLLLKPFSDNLVVLFLGGIIVPTVLEYITATVMEMLFHTSWWDYSDKKYNIKGRICLGSSIAWGFMTVLLFTVLQPFVMHIVDLYPVVVGKRVVVIVTVLYLIDFGISVAGATALTNRIQKMHSVMNEIAGILEIEGSFMELKEKIQEFEDSRAEFKEKILEFKQKYTMLLNKGNYIQKRFIKSYPNMKSKIQNRQDYLIELKEFINEKKEKIKNGQFKN